MKNQLLCDYLNGTFLAREFQENSSDLQTELVEKIWCDQSLFLLLIIIFINSHKILSLVYILHIVRRNSCWYTLLELKGLTDSLMSRHYFSTAALTRPSLNQLLTESIPIGGQFQLQSLFSASRAWEKLDCTPFYKHKW